MVHGRSLRHCSQGFYHLLGFFQADHGVEIALIARNSFPNGAFEGLETVVLLLSLWLLNRHVYKLSITEQVQDFFHQPFLPYGLTQQDLQVLSARSSVLIMNADKGGPQDTGKSCQVPCYRIVVSHQKLQDN